MILSIGHDDKFKKIIQFEIYLQQVESKELITDQ